MTLGLAALIGLLSTPTAADLGEAAGGARELLERCAEDADGCSTSVDASDLARAFLVRATEVWVLQGTIDAEAVASARVIDPELVDGWWTTLPSPDAAPASWVLLHWGEGEDWGGDDGDELGSLDPPESAPRATRPGPSLWLGAAGGVAEVLSPDLAAVADALAVVQGPGPIGLVVELRLLLAPADDAASVAGGRALVGPRLRADTGLMRLEFDFLGGGARSTPWLAPSLYASEEVGVPRASFDFAARALARIGAPALGFELRAHAEPTVARFMADYTDGRHVESEALISQGQQFLAAFLLEVPLPHRLEVRLALQGGVATTWNHGQARPTFGVTLGLGSLTR
jgi:hypothetical protein